MSWFSDFFHPEKAYQGAQQERENYYNQGQANQQPYNQMGQEAGNYLKNIMDKFGDPAKLQDEWAKGYETSPYAKQMMGQAQESGLGAASQMGLMGSSSALNNIQNQASTIMQGDRQNYMNDLMQKYMAGAGIGQGMYGTGAGAAGQMNQNAQAMGQDSAQNRYNQMSAGGNMFGNMLGGGMGLLGGMLGGPMGGAFGNYFGKMMGNQKNNLGNYY